MADAKLDQLVKGQPPPNVSPNQVAQEVRQGDQAAPSSITAPIAPHSQHDPRDALPSSPPQIYLNLLILESSLRLQYLSLRARLRLHLLSLSALTAWVLLFTWLLFFRPREDGSGVGGSVYWVVETSERLGWGGGVVTMILVFATGMYDRGVRWPRRFISTTNRGLRQFNLKIVVVRGNVLSQALSAVTYLLSPWHWNGQDTRRVSFHIVPKDIESAVEQSNEKKTQQQQQQQQQPPQELQWNAHAARYGLIEEDVATAGDVLKLLLLPKPFSPDFREGWEQYRIEYWDRENARRASLRRVIKVRRREVAKQEGGWLWWTGWRGWQNMRLVSGAKSRRQRELEKLALREKPSYEMLREKERLRRREVTLRSESSASSRSRASSRASTPGYEPEGKRSRRGSNAAQTTGGSLRRSKRAAAAYGSKLGATDTIVQEGEVENADPPVRRESLRMSRMTPDPDLREIKVEGEEA